MNGSGVQQQVPSWPQGAWSRVRAHRWTAKAEALPRDSTQPIQPLGGLTPQAAGQSLCSAEPCCQATLLRPMEVAELGWGKCGCSPPPLRGRRHSARSPEPFGSSSARKARGDEHVPVPVAGTKDLLSTLSLRGPQPVPLCPQPRVALLGLRGEPSWRGGPEAWRLCEEVPVPGGRLHWSVRGALGEWDRGQGALWGDGPLAHPVPPAQRHEGLLCLRP